VARVITPHRPALQEEEKKHAKTSTWPARKAPRGNFASLHGSVVSSHDRNALQRQCVAVEEERRGRLAMQPEGRPAARRFGPARPEGPCRAWAATQARGMARARPGPRGGPLNR
jgi:hypothetical protein